MIVIEVVFQVLFFQEFQEKILFELYLFVVGLGIENYCKLKKDVLVFVIMEKQVDVEGQSFVCGYFDIMLDGYGFLQVDLFDLVSCLVFVMVGVIKQYYL